MHEEYFPTLRDLRTPEGFTAAVQSMEDLLFSVSYSILRSREACRDVVQTALMKAWGRRYLIRNPDTFRAWLVQIVRNECMNYLRDHRDMSLLMDAPTADEPEVRCDIRSALMKLTSVQQTVVMLYYFQGYPVREIAGILSLPTATVSSHLKRARKKLKEELSNYV